MEKSTKKNITQNKVKFGKYDKDSASLISIIKRGFLNFVVVKQAELISNVLNEQLRSQHPE